jgi:hypothetical protein
MVIWAQPLDVAQVRNSAHQAVFLLARDWFPLYPGRFQPGVRAAA